MSVTFAGGMRWPMPWCGRVVVRLVLGQDAAQVRRTKDQQAVQRLAAQGSKRGVRRSRSSRRLDSAAQNPGPGGLERDLRQLGIVQKHGQPNHPQTQDKAGRCHQTLKKWLRARPAQPATITGLQDLLDTFAVIYNTLRGTGLWPGPLLVTGWDPDRLIGNRGVVVRVAAPTLACGT